MANITSFSPKNNSSITVDNSTYWVENADQSWSLSEPDANTLRFELRSGDHWSSPAWTDPTSSQRDEVAGQTVYAPGTQINLSYDFMVEPGATDTANGPGRWTVLGQMHEYNVSDSPPFAVELVNGDHMAINIGTGNPVYLYTDPNPIQRGHYYSMNIQVKFDNNGNGFLEVWRDGVQIVNYHGSIGTGAATYWKEGLYRSSASETMAVDYRNLHITTGSAPVPPVTTPTHSATTPTQPATTPSVTQVVASPSTGIEFPGDKISLMLKFNEAVTVTGKPTLSLNDGGTATYTGGSGTNTLTFTDTVRSSDKTVSALAVTAVNLPGGASVKDAAGRAAHLSGAVRTLSGLGIDPPTSVASHPPTISIKDPSLSMPAHGKIDLGLSVTAPDSAHASVTISGLPRYEAITDNLDHKTFHGSSITLSEAEVDSGLTLQSNSWHSGHPATKLTVTAHDSTAGGSASSAARTITVTNLPAAHPTMSSFALLNQHLAGDFDGNTGQGEITSHSSWAHNDWVLASSRH